MAYDLVQKNKTKFSGKSSWDFPVYANRNNAIPVDGTSIWTSVAEAETYAQECAVAYVGQILSVIETDVVRVFKIAPDKSLVELNDSSAKPIVIEGNDYEETPTA